MQWWVNKAITEVLCKLNVKITDQEICSNNSSKCLKPNIFLKHMESKKLVLILLWASSLIPTPQNDKKKKRKKDKHGERENKNNSNHEFCTAIPQDPSHLIYYIHIWWTNRFVSNLFNTVYLNYLNFQKDLPMFNTKGAWGKKKKTPQPTHDMRRSHSSRSATV